jgi:hypothetical protein
MFRLMVVWFCCCYNEGLYSLCLAYCSVVFALAISVTGEQFRRAQFTTSWWPKQLNFQPWFLVCSAPSLRSPPYVQKCVLFDRHRVESFTYSDVHRSLQNCGFSVCNLCISFIHKTCAGPR